LVPSSNNSYPYVSTVNDFYPLCLLYLSHEVIGGGTFGIYEKVPSGGNRKNKYIMGVFTQKNNLSTCGAFDFALTRFNYKTIVYI